MQSSRFPRFKRSSEIAPIQITERDRKILRFVHRYRFLRSPQIVALIRDSSQQVLRRLQLLYHHGYLERPRTQLDYYHQGGSRHIAYGLGDKGAKLLKRELGIAFHEVHWGEKNRSVGRIFLEHALLVSDVMVSLELACRKSTRVRLLAEEEIRPKADKSSKRYAFRWKVKLEGRQLGVIPDRTFALEFEGKHGGRERAFFFFEADRGTMPVKRRTLSQTSFHRKLLAYKATWSKSIHQTRFGFHRFRVLTVTKSAARLTALVEACSQLKSGRGLFLFADQSALQDTSDIFPPIWRTATQAESVSLLPISPSPKTRNVAV